MEAIIERINDYVRTIVQGWDTIDTVTVLRFGTDRFDPSFFISYDLYYHGVYPKRRERSEAFSDVSMFEASVDDRKDRFLFEEIPIRMEYKAITDVDLAVSKARNPEKSDVLGTTYGLYRLVTADPVLQRSTWLTVVRRTLGNLPEAFWSRRVDVLRAHMEHALSDLTSAVFADEPLFYQLSLARFLETACNLLLAVNRRFEPAGRGLRAAISELPTVPEEFESRLEFLLGRDPSMKRTRKREVAELIAKSILRIS
ncbi:MAG: hypothetical protein ACLFR8_02845 [Alkalispirochaeta sp.]